MKDKDIFSRFVSKIEFTDKCWLWTASVRTDGYGQFRVERNTLAAHRFAYESMVGPLPPVRRMVIDHLCRTPRCVNPDHLELVTQQENARRGNAGKHLSSRTACSHGHPYTPETTKLCKRDGARICLTCQRERKMKRNGNRLPA